MQHDFKKLRLVLQDQADGPYALERMRELLIQTLKDWPQERYHVVDYLLPWGRPIAARSRKTIEGLLAIVDTLPSGSETSILKLTKMCELIYV